MERHEHPFAGWAPREGTGGRWPSQQRAQVLTTVRKQREALSYRHPDPEALWSQVSGGRLWERRRGDSDFGVVRVGLGPQELATPLVMRAGQAGGAGRPRRSADRRHPPAAGLRTS